MDNMQAAQRLKGIADSIRGGANETIVVVRYTPEMAASLVADLDTLSGALTAQAQAKVPPPPPPSLRAAAERELMADPAPAA